MKTRNLSPLKMFMAMAEYRRPAPRAQTEEGERIPNRNSRPCLLLRETYRQDGKVNHRTIANLSKWPPAVVDGLRRLLKS